MPDEARRVLLHAKRMPLFSTVVPMKDPAVCDEAGSTSASDEAKGLDCNQCLDKQPRHENVSHDAEQCRPAKRQSRRLPRGGDAGGQTATRAAMIYDRRRTAKACSVCRVRKTRCDSQRPSCGFCLATGADCTYSELEATR